jgi:hypothetical protein
MTIEVLLSLFSGVVGVLGIFAAFFIFYLGKGARIQLKLFDAIVLGANGTPERGAVVEVFNRGPESGVIQDKLYAFEPGAFVENGYIDYKMWAKYKFSPNRSPGLDFKIGDRFIPLQKGQKAVFELVTTELRSGGRLVSVSFVEKLRQNLKQTSLLRLKRVRVGVKSSDGTIWSIRLPKKLAKDVQQNDEHS